jgi:hypothetical protein
VIGFTSFFAVARRERVVDSFARRPIFGAVLGAKGILDGFETMLRVGGEVARAVNRS